MDKIFLWTSSMHDRSINLKLTNFIPRGTDRIYNVLIFFYLPYSQNYMNNQLLQFDLRHKIYTANSIKVLLPKA